MSDISSNNQNNTRHFDWGPPSNNTSDRAKEWLVYLVILLILGIGVWGLLDLTNTNSHQFAVPHVTDSANKTIAKNLENTTNQDGTTFIVQLGAFSDEKAARNSYKSLVDAGYFPTFSPPDDEYEIYRVSIGPFKSEMEANKVSEKLNSLDFSCFVVESH